MTATLVLAGETPGQPATSSNFVSFSYDGSNRAPAFTILPGGSTTVTFSALFLDQATQYADVYFQEADGGTIGWMFSTGSDGTFNLAYAEYGGGAVDQGTDATWTAVASVPEAPSYTLVGLGLVAAMVIKSGRSSRLR